MSETASTRTPLSPTPRSSLTRSKERGRTDRAELDAVLDAGMVCHLGVVRNGSPVVIPTIYGRDGDTLFLHGSTGSPNMRAAMAHDVSLTVTHVDGIVYARSAMHFSMNYRSAVIHARPVELTDPDERMHALRVIVEQTAPGAWDAVRPPNKKEMAATLVLAVDLTEASVKVRTGGPRDEQADIDTGGVWAGVLPLRQLFDAPIPAADLEAGVEIPAHVRRRCSDTAAAV
ncbi:pyridoxamine 5'-phosphate oxidase family protein [Nocardia aurantiaca]|uniref:Pyridoxamine 5'-phosphate oxidase family protein n=1 Tax=Nocardia aurantiaca TaxID=2675850 RepID=A0A6I3L1G4_9NOCA|nr:pyridoxamine 5'-phosphate oxidase family protein [Nocardia aurantiaca]MTE15581.1 pyridoxamine 5'-phosphate oxidase family protein [Nocardia aurantiaca]